MRVDLIYDEVKGEKTYKRARLDEREGVLIHRVGKDRATGVDFGDSAEEICEAFTEGPAAPFVGGKVPYTFIVEKGGRIAQALPLTWIGPHAAALSRSWLSVAFVGDFRYESPSDEAFLGGIFLVRNLLGTLGRGISAVRGHTEPEMVALGSTKNRNKQCPGARFDLYKFRSALSGGFAL